MRSFIYKHHRLVFYTSWIILGLIQSGCTELQDDEAYYWVYSKFLSWGYFDHPPMIALLIKLGWAFFHNELGVRFFLLVLNVLSLVLIENLIDKKNPRLFYTIVLSLAVLQLAGFMAVPDTPLIFFTALFFWVYKKFLQHAGLLNTFLLGIVMAALFYSKYHAALVVFFVVLSNLKLFTRYQTYLAALFSLLFFAPHLWWQYQHDWISFRYHLFESNVNRYKISYTTGYIIGQILLAGPLTGLVLLPAAFKYKPADVFEKGLKFTMAGIYIFFLLSSFRGMVEGNWTSAAIVPLIILSHNWLLQKPNWQKWLVRLTVPTIILVVLARIVMIFDVLPIKAVKEKYHSWKHWPKEMRERTHSLPVVFQNSYQRASKYWFYTGQMTYSQNMYRERKNNYNYWPIEDSILGKPVYILDIYKIDSFPNKLITEWDTIGYKYDSMYASFSKLQFKTPEKKIYGKSYQPVVLNVSANGPKRYYNFINNHPQFPVEIRVGIFNNRRWLKDIYLSKTLNEMITQPQSIQINPFLPPGKYYLIFSVRKTGTISSTHNSDKIPLIIE